MKRADKLFPHFTGESRDGHAVSGIHFLHIEVPMCLQALLRSDYES
jgi:hypothetical protein